MNSRFRQTYWDLNNLLSRILPMCKKENRSFARIVINSYIQHYLGLTPVVGKYRMAIENAVAWIIRAHKTTPDDGVSHGYFPTYWENGWRPSYPETTGYIIPTLIEYAKQYNYPKLMEYAISMSHWESDIQMDNGAVQGGPVSDKKQKAAVFNTGMVLQGWTAIWRETKIEKFFDSAKRAADFLMGDIDKDGHFRTHGEFVSNDRIKTYNVLCSWALYRFGEDSQNEMYIEAALKNGNATILQQVDNGWFCNCCLTNPRAPLTHTIGYTLQGLFEIGLLSSQKKFITAVEKSLNAIIKKIHKNGYLSGRFDQNWNPKANYSCLTGSAQIAIVLYRMFKLTGNRKYLDAADSLVNYLKAVQITDSPNDNLNGAIPGSFPLLGAYMSAGYPNWATKYFIDAVMLQETI